MECPFVHPCSFCFVFFFPFIIKCQFGQGMLSWKVLTSLWSPGMALFHRQHPQECCVLFYEQWHWHKEEQFSLPPATNLPGWHPSLAARLCFFSSTPRKFSLSFLWSGSRPICSHIFLHRVEIKFYKSVLLKQQNTWGTILESGRGISTVVLKILKC